MTYTHVVQSERCIADVYVRQPPLGRSSMASLGISTQSQALLLVIPVVSDGSGWPGTGRGQ